MNALYERATWLFDWLHSIWEHERIERLLATFLVLFFIGGLAMIEANIRGLLPEPLAHLTPTNHFYAIKLAFTLVLVIEVIGLVFVLPASVSKAVGKQFEILCLILLRNSFKELVNFTEPIELSGGLPAPLFPMLAEAAGALAVFSGLMVYYRLYRHRRGLKEKIDLYSFVAEKKIVALFLLAAFAGIGVFGLYETAMDRPHFDPFAVFYTVLIFSDILIVLLAQRHLPSFAAIFRNSGFAVATLLIRLALAAKPYADVLLGIFSVAFAIGLTLAYNAFLPQRGEAPGLPAHLAEPPQK
jgi:hypothetical protein